MAPRLVGGRPSTPCLVLQCTVRTHGYIAVGGCGNSWWCSRWRVTARVAAMQRLDSRADVLRLERVQVCSPGCGNFAVKALSMHVYVRATTPSAVVSTSACHAVRCTLCSTQAPPSALHKGIDASNAKLAQLQVDEARASALSSIAA